MAGSYNSWSLGYKMDIGDRMALAMILDQPIGANVNYPAGTGLSARRTTAELTSNAITALLRYKFENNVSVSWRSALRDRAWRGSLPFIGGYADHQPRLRTGLCRRHRPGKTEIAARVALTTTRRSPTLSSRWSSVRQGALKPGFPDR
jgi:hypothetical protein